MLAEAIGSASNPPGVVDVYDSMGSYWTPDKEFELRYIDVQHQSGSADCGLFAIAFADALCNGMDPHLVEL